MTKEPLDFVAQALPSEKLKKINVLLGLELSELFTLTPLGVTRILYRKHFTEKVLNPAQYRYLLKLYDRYRHGDDVANVLETFKDSEVL